ncbi:MAG: putative RNA-binding protein, contains TRAM domain protein [uncultured archaeon A07HB70]|jgi:Predicted RNA-binding protein, contains TRAM domain|nr:MAG: putative RNA-binding protein, contains TRAM domain protein [uncultured archaeon A07HB70]
MELSPALRCLFSGRIEEDAGSYTITVPKSEIDLGTLRAGEVYRVGILNGTAGAAETPPDSTEPRGEDRDDPTDGPPVTEGEVRQVEIEDVGDQGDGLARVGPGYVVFVSGASVGDRPTVRITSARENVAFAEVVN